MKQIILFLFLIAFIYPAAAQVVDVVTGVGGPSGLSLRGDEIFISEYNDGQVSKIDISTTNPAVVEVGSGAGGPFGLAASDDYVFIAESTNNRISKINLTNPVATLETIVAASYTSGMVLNGNDLYYLLAIAAGNEKVMKIDITEASPTPVEILTSGLNGATGLAISGNELFIANFSGNEIIKIDITVANPTPVTVIANEIISPNHLFIYGNDLYFSEHNAGRVSKLDITETTPTVINIATGLSNPTGIVVKNDVVYFSQYGANKISKVEPVGVDTPEEAQQLSVYPNPSTDYLIIEGLPEAEIVVVTDLVGRTIKTIQTDKILPVEDLMAGVYFIHSNHLKTTKIIKQ